MIIPSSMAGGFNLTTPMHLIVYMSEYIGGSSSMFSDIGDIISTSKKKNPERGITGILLYHQGKFVQVLEGEEEELRKLMKKIATDTRHTNVQILIDEDIPQRGFDQWNMDFFNLSDKESLDYEAMKEISRLYRKQPLIKSNQLVQMYETLIKEGIMVHE